MCKSMGGGLFLEQNHPHILCPFFLCINAMGCLAFSHSYASYVALSSQTSPRHLQHHNLVCQQQFTHDKLSLTINGLTIANQAGKLLWSTPPFNSEVSAMQLSEIGNLVLVGTQNATLWESFEYLTDTIVMGQRINVGKVL